MDRERSISVVTLRGWPIERRLHKRGVSDNVILTFLGANHTALDWSQGGILIADIHPELPIGTRVSGLLRIRGSSGFFRFSAELLRRDAQAGQVAFRFDNISPALLEVLSRLAERAANRSGAASPPPVSPSISL
jgi:PilZ domain